VLSVGTPSVRRFRGWLFGGPCLDVVDLLLLADTYEVVNDPG
jgi:hypothetical protein